MDERKKLLFYSGLYDHSQSDKLFMIAMKRNIYLHQTRCKGYRRILSHSHFCLDDLKQTHDLHKLPPIPTLLFKTHSLWSIHPKRVLLSGSSSGTRGRRSNIGYDLKSLFYAAGMVARTASFHQLISLVPTNYLVLGYEPHPSNPAMVVKTQNASRLYAPLVLHTEYALRFRNGAYVLNFHGFYKALEQYARMPFPVRLIGFPSYTYFFLQKLEQTGTRYRLPKGSRLILGGGWKQFYKEQVDRQEFFRLVEHVLGIPRSHCTEFFGAVEHPVVYCSCKNHHFHVPICSKVMIRDVKTLEPLGYGQTGLLNLLTPLADSMPLSSIMTDDLAVLHEGADCGCGCPAPYFKIIGRVGMPEIKTCAANAQELLK